MVPPPNHPDARRANALWAHTLLDVLARSGVRRVVVAPGSRSTPLVLALAADARFETAVQVDERSAGFLALGVGKATGLPAAVITTSGTAVANLLPSVVEAAQSGTPLLLLTADRPPRLREADANQAIRQPGIFGAYVRFEAELSPAEVSSRTLRHLRNVASRAVAAAVGDPAGPVHLNLPFEKPLEPAQVPFADASASPAASPAASAAASANPAASASASPAASANPGATAGGGGENGTDARSEAGSDGAAEGGTHGGRDDNGPLAGIVRIPPVRMLPPDEELEALAAALRAARRPLLVAGPLPRPREAGAAILSLARTLGLPLLADPLSGARLGAGVAGGDARTGDPPGVSYDLALRAVASGRSDPGAGPPAATGTSAPAERGGVAAPGIPEPDLIIRFGATPSSASLARWLAHLARIRQVVVDPGGRWKDHQAVADELIWGDPVRVARWLEEALRPRDAAKADRKIRREGSSLAWQEVDARMAQVAAAHVQEGLPEGAVALACAREAQRTGATLFVSNSMPIRDVDALWPVAAGALPPPAPATLDILGNRGASGIDGIVSTALGVAWGSGRRVVALLGDLALLHDMNGLLRARAGGVPDAPGAPALKVDMVVVHNDGGGIFHLLPVRDHEPHFTPFVATPHGLEPGAVAALYGLPFRRIEARGGASTEPIGARAAGPDGARAAETADLEASGPGAASLRARLESALTWAADQPGCTLLEVRTDRHENRQAHEALAAAVVDALTSASPIPASERP